MTQLIKLLRVHQWTKNAVCLVGVIFSGRFVDPHSVAMAVAVTVAFCLASSAIYIWNDCHDRERDRLHPKKRRRPVASGKVSVLGAMILSISLLSASLTTGYYLGPPVVICLSLYLLNNILYSEWLKHLVLFDVLCIVVGFVLRLMAGVYAISEIPTAWIILCTFFLAAFLGFCKRRAELKSTKGGHEGKESHLHQRPVLGQYTVDYLDFLISSSATMTTLSYAIFVTTSGKNPSLIITLPVVYYAIMHYKWLVMIGETGQEPEYILLKDVHILLSIVIWLGLYMFIWLGQVNIIR